MPDTGDGRPSLFEELLAEHAGPYRGRVGDLDLDVDSPTADTVCELDDVNDPSEVLDLLVGPELADDILDELDCRPAHELADLLEDMRRHWALLDTPAGGMTRVVEEIDCYGEAIEADLILSGGLLLIDWFRDPDRWPWSLLLRLLPRLPEGGHYDTARRDDDELAAHIDDLIREGTLVRPPRPPLLGYTRERALLQDILDVLRRIEHAEWAASPKFKGKGGRPPKATPRPVSAMDRLAEQQRIARLDEIAVAMLGDRARILSRRIPLT